MMKETVEKAANDLVVSALEKNVAMIRFDLNRRVIDVNRNFAEAMGYDPQRMIGM